MRVARAAGKRGPARAARDEAPTRAVSAVVHVAVVHAGDEICFVTAAASREDLARRLGPYVREHVSYQLEPAEADRVRRLLSQEQWADAVDRYFARVGRWAPDRLVTRVVPMAEPPDPT